MSRGFLMTLSRRSLMRWMGRAMLGTGFAGIFAGPAAAADRRTTPAQIEGPYYPSVKPEEADWNLLKVGDGPLPDGEPLDLRGVVHDRRGNAVAGARVEIWQCDSHGIYDHPGHDNRDQFDRRFQGYGRAVTDAEGRYRFLTLMPVPYGDRPPHIHVTIRSDTHDTLTTQLYLKDHPENDRDGLLALMIYPGQDLLMIEARDADLGLERAGKRGDFDFVLV